MLFVHVGAVAALGDPPGHGGERGDGHGDGAQEEQIGEEYDKHYREAHAAGHQRRGGHGLVHLLETGDIAHHAHHRAVGGGEGSGHRHDALPGGGVPAVPEADVAGLQGGGHVVRARDDPRGNAGGGNVQLSLGVQELELQPGLVLEALRIVVGALVVLGARTVNIISKKDGGSLRLGLERGADGGEIVGAEGKSIGRDGHDHRQQHEARADGETSGADGVEVKTPQPRQKLPRLVSLRDGGGIFLWRRSGHQRREQILHRSHRVLILKLRIPTYSRSPRQW